MTALALLPPDLTGATLALLLVTSFAGSFLTIAFGLGGGGLLLGVMASLMPPAALVPVHGVVQFGSNAGRALLMARHIRWAATGRFLAGITLGIAIAAQGVVALPPAALQIGIGLFLTWTVLANPPRWMRNLPFVTGLATAGVSMFFGAAGPFVATYLKTLNLPRHAHVGTMAALQTLQHLLKSVAFGMLGFAYAPWAGFMALMILAGLAGTWAGGKVLNRLTDRGFRRALDAVLLLLAVQLVWTGLAGL